MSVAAIALVALSNRQRNRLIAVALAAGAVLAILTSQGRGALVASVVTLVAFGLLSATTRDRVRVILGAAAAALVCYLVISAVLGGTDSGSFRFQRLGPDQLVQSTNESRGDVLGLLVRAAGDYPLGAGLATGGPGAGVSGKSALSGTINTESELSYLVVETGILGLLIIVGFTLRLLILGFARCRREPDAETRLLIAAVVAPLAGVLVLYYPGVVTSSVPIAPYLWAAGGIVSYWLVTRQRMLRDAPPIAGGRETPVRPAPTPPERALAPPA